MNNCLIQSGVTRIGSYAFDSCDGLTSVEISSTVTKIGDCAFSGCTVLTSVDLLPTVTEIGSYAFALCSGLDSIHIPASVTNIGTGAFRGCKNIFVDESNPAYSSDLLGCLYNKDKTVFIQYPNSNPRTRFAIPDSVTEIRYNAFQGSVYLTSVSFGRNLEHFEGYTFADCDALVSVSFPDNIKGFNAYAFCGCSNLTTVTLGKGMQSIGWYAFPACENLTTVIIPRNITQISFDAFSYTENIKDVYYAGSEEEWANVEIGVFNDGLLNATMHFNYEYDEHVHIYDPTVISPTCTTVGKIEFSCVCGDSYEEELPIDPDAHDMQLGECVLETCTTDGYTPWFCTRCGKETRTDLVTALGHQWDDGELKKPPTCSTPGIFVTTCKREGCGETIVKELAKDPNAHVLKTTVVPPTCLDEGYTSHACTLCRYGYADNEVPALGHAALDENGDCPRCHRHIQDMPQPEPSEEEQPSPKLNFFQRIIQWFKDLFAKLFKKKT